MNVEEAEELGKDRFAWRSTLSAGIEDIDYIKKNIIETPGRAWCILKKVIQ